MDLHGKWQREEVTEMSTSKSILLLIYLSFEFKTVPKLFEWWAEKLKKSQDGAVIHIYLHVLRKALYTLSLFASLLKSAYIIFDNGFVSPFAGLLRLWHLYFLEKHGDVYGIWFRFLFI